MIKQFLIKELELNENYQKGNYHQALMDIAYMLWQSEETKDWSYKEMLYEITQKYGLLIKIAVMLGNCNYQVENGGWLQYYQNGYVFPEGDFEDYLAPGASLFGWLIEKLKTTTLIKNDTGKKVIALFESVRFKVDKGRYIQERIDCDACDGYGYTVEDDCEEICSYCKGIGYYYEEVQNENYGEILNSEELDKLSSKYYKLNEEWMKCLNIYFKSEIDKFKQNNPCHLVCA